MKAPVTAIAGPAGKRDFSGETVVASVIDLAWSKAGPREMMQQ